MVYKKRIILKKLGTLRQRKREYLKIYLQRTLHQKILDFFKYFARISTSAKYGFLWISIKVSFFWDPKYAVSKEKSGTS